MELTLKTSGQFDFVDITEQINGILPKLSVRDGAVLVFSKHTTASLVINESEEGVKEDAAAFWKRLLPPEMDYRHNQLRQDDNAHAHLLAMFLGPSVVLPVKDGRLDLGTWQRVFLVELDKPRIRQVVIKVVSI